MWEFLIGAMFGAVMGFFTCALMTMGQNSDREAELMHLKMRLDKTGWNDNE